MSFIGSFKFLLHSAAFLSVMIVVAASAVSQSIIDRAPIIFLKAAEGPAS